MNVRQFSITNAVGETRELLPDRSGADGIYFVGVSGLGFTTEGNYQRIGNSYVEIEYNYEQKEPSGAFVFKGLDPYKMFYEFARFLSSRPLVLHYTTFDNKVFNIDVNVSSIEKGERNYPNALLVNITFKSLGLYYTDPQQMNSGDDDAPAMISMYPILVNGGTAYTNGVPMSLTDPVGYLEAAKLVDEKPVYIYPPTEFGQVISRDVSYEDMIINDWTANKGINSSVSVVDISSPKGYETMQYTIVSCEPGDIFIITGSGDSQYPGARLWCFIDIDTNRLTVAASGATVNELMLTAPENASMLIVNTLVDQGTLKYRKVVDVGEIPYEDVNGAYPKIQTSFVEINSDSYTESPCKLSITASNAAIKNPHWYHYCDNVLKEEGIFYGTLPQGNRLDIDTTSIPYTIKQFNADGAFIADRYGDCDFSTDRFVFVQHGVNRYSVSHDGTASIKIDVIARVEYESV